MPKKKLPDPNEKPQRERFKEAAEKAGGIDAEAFEQAIGKLAPPKRPKKQ